jgi:EmrB/QacA subfamily drug resistance transporter
MVSHGREAGPAFVNPLEDPLIRRLGAVVIIGSFMSVLDTTIVNVAIETLSRDFRSPLSTIQWVTTGYLLALALVIPMSGWVVERFGSRRMWLVSLVLFTLGSALCGLAWSPASLIVFRFLQGAGGGMLMPIGQSVLARAAGPQRMGRMMSVIGVPTLLAPVLGPVLGGLIVDNLSWRWIFFVNVPIGVVGLALSLKWLPGGDRVEASRFDVTGMALLSPGLAALLYGLSEAGVGSGLADPVVIGCLGGGALLIAAFVLHARRSDRPLLDVRLFAERGFAAANVTLFLVVGAIYGAMFLLPLYYQILRGDSALSAGLLMAPQGIGAALMMPIGGRLTDRIGAGRVVPIGMTVVLIGTVLYTQVSPTTSYALLALSLFIRGLGAGWTMMPSSAAAYSRLSHDAVPRATTALNIVMRIGGSFGTAVVALVLQRQIDTRLPTASHLLSTGVVGGARRLAPRAAVQLGHAFGASFWTVLVMTCVGLGATFLLPRVRPSGAAAAVGTDGQGQVGTIPGPAVVGPHVVGEAEEKLRTQPL